MVAELGEDLVESFAERELESHHFFGVTVPLKNMVVGLGVRDREDIDDLSASARDNLLVEPLLSGGFLLYEWVDRLLFGHLGRLADLGAECLNRQVVAVDLIVLVVQLCAELLALGPGQLKLAHELVDRVGRAGLGDS